MMLWKQNARFSHVACILSDVVAQQRRLMYKLFRENSAHALRVFHLFEHFLNTIPQQVHLYAAPKNKKETQQW
jgi:hypothetical protein